MAVPNLETFSLREILQEPPEKADWIIEDFITTGLHLLVGPPKAGKSWLALDMAISVAQGESFLGFATAKSDVIYLALEDTRNRLKTRSWKLVDETSGELTRLATEGVDAGVDAWRSLSTSR